MDFEEGVTGWIEEDSKKAGKICNDESSYPHSGEWSYHYWNADAFEINLYQQVKIDKTEQSNLQLWSQGIGDSELFLELYIADKEGNEIASTEFKNTGWNEWQHPCVSASLMEGDAETDTYMTLYVMNEDGKIIESVEFENEGWSIWQTPVLENVSLQENQTVVIGIIIHGKANGWGTIDDISCIRK